MPRDLALRRALALPRSLAVMIALAAAPLSAQAQADRVALSAPYFGQTLDWPWGGDFMGESRALVADNGCVMCCAAMALRVLGLDADPGVLNRDLAAKGLYTEMSFRGERLGRMGFSYESIRALYPRVKGLKMRGKIASAADAEALRAELRAGRPIIATVTFRGVYNHAILIYGYEGSEFLVHDPMDPRNRSLSEYAANAGNASSAPFDCVIGTAAYSLESR